MPNTSHGHRKRRNDSKMPKRRAHEWVINVVALPIATRAFKTHSLLVPENLRDIFKGRSIQKEKFDRDMWRNSYLVAIMKTSDTVWNAVGILGVGAVRIGILPNCEQHVGSRREADTAGEPAAAARLA